jgi:hypothetical protein
MVSLIIAQQARAVSAQGRIHVIEKNFLGLKKMAVSVYDHKICDPPFCPLLGEPYLGEIDFDP